MAEKREMAEKAVEAGRRAGNSLLESIGWHSVFVVALVQGDMAAAREAQRCLAEIAKEMKSVTQDHFPLVTRATLMLAKGCLGESEKTVFEAFAHGQATGFANAQIAFGGQLSLLRWYQGRFAEMESVWRGIVQQSPDVETFQAALALALLDAGKTDEAERVFDSLAEAGFANIPEDGNWMAAMIVLADVCARLDKREGAADLYEVMSRYPDRNATAGNAVSYGPIARGLGMLATVLERWDDAERHFLYSIGMSERGGMRPALAQTRLN